MTVLLHEYGNAWGLSDFPGRGDPGYLMNAFLEPGMRRLPSGSDVQIHTMPDTADPQHETGPTIDEILAMIRGEGLQGGVSAQGNIGILSDAAPPFSNGSFVLSTDYPAVAWAVIGEVTIADNQAVIGESAGAMSGLSHIFALPSEATGLQFTLRNLTLGAPAGAVPDAFEVALLDTLTGVQVLAPITGLSMTDAFLNIQADGTRHVSAGVSIDAVGTDLVVTVDLAGIGARPDTVLLTFDLLGQALLESSVAIAEVRLLGLTEYHESARIDRQLYGRAGRQGDPGSAEAIVSLEDDLFSRFSPLFLRLVRLLPLPWLCGLMRRHAQARAEAEHATTRREQTRSDRDSERALAFTGPVE